ncbi:MAG TPA: threonine synthase [Bacteroidota bacterium]|nr:threonine synthase [Bacteroidota bacterium]
MTTYLTHLRCSECDEKFSSEKVQTFCPSCNAPLVVEYDLERARREISPETFLSREGTLWRYRELLPVVREDAVVSLGEGWTPLIRVSVLGNEVGIRNLYVKEEGYNPTGSFKARGLCMAVSKAKELGITEVAMPSAGNAGGALAAYAAKAGMKAHVFVPKDTPEVNIREVTLFGGEINLVDGVISDAGKRMNEMNSDKRWFDMSTMKEPYRLEGKKTMGYELAEQFQWKLPDVILYPTGGGTGLIGMWKAFDEMERLGWISGKRPKMVSVQTEGCAPVVKAFKEGKKSAEFWNNATTRASGLRVPKAFADKMILRALYESGGTAIAVSDEHIMEEMLRTAKSEGIFLCPEGAAAVAAMRTLKEENFISGTDTVVVFNTGTGYKYTELYLRQV